MSGNKLDAAGIGWIGRKIIKEDLTKDPSANAMNYVKFTANYAPTRQMMMMKKKMMMMMNLKP